MKKPVLKILLLLGSLLVIAIGVAFLFPAKPLPPLKPLPDPNGYTLMISSAKMLTNLNEISTSSPEELKSLVEANSNALQSIRSAFSNEWRVPIFLEDAGLSNHMTKLPMEKIAAQAFFAEGRLAEIENQPDAAARSYLDCIGLGVRSARGGVVIDGLVSLGVETIGTRNLEKIVSQLNSSTCKEIAQSLEQLDAQRESWSATVKNEHEWSQRAFPDLHKGIRALLQRQALDPALKKFQARFEKQQTELRQLILQLAARAYELDKGEAPKAASDLVPVYLKAVPQNPSTGLELPYP